MIRVFAVFVFVRLGLFALTYLNGVLPLHSSAEVEFVRDASGARYYSVPSPRFDPLGRFDSRGYLIIAFYDYDHYADQRSNTKFFPGFPWLADGFYRLVKRFIPEAVRGTETTRFIAASIASNLLFAGALLFFFLWVRKHHGESVAVKAGFLMTLSPISFLLFCVLSEATFLFFAIPAFLAAERRRWFWCAVFAAACAVTRPVGAAATLAFLYMYWVERRASGRDFGLSWLWFALVPLSLVGVFLHMAERNGDILAYFKLQSRYLGHSFPDWSTLPEVLALWRKEGLDLARDLAQTGAILFIVAGTILLARRRNASPSAKAELVFTVVLAAVPLLSGSLISMTRYAVTLFPVFGAVAGRMPDGKRSLLLWIPLGAMQAALFVLWMHNWPVII